MKRLYILTMFTVLMAGIIFFFKKRIPTTIPAGRGLVISKEWLIINKNPLTPEKDRRPADQTFLTLPEWYLVFSPDEQAQYFKQHTATGFPFMSHTRQIWESYHIVNDQIKEDFPPNKGYHFMIWVIGSSASAEYSIKALYETLIGRITDTHSVLTAEDRFNAIFTQDYVDFIKDRPWYEFNFKNQLKKLWADIPFFGDHFLRKAERRYILTSELLVKYVYGKLIGLGTKEVYDQPLPTTAVILDKAADNKELKIVKKFDDGSMLLFLPRYDKFSPAVLELAKQGYSFKEIAGNNSAVLLTVIIPTRQDLQFNNAKIVFTQPVSSNAEMKRIALAVPVPRLNKLLLDLDKKRLKIEHVFDY